MNDTQSKQPYEMDPLLCPRSEKAYREAQNLANVFEYIENFYPSEYFRSEGKDCGPFPRITDETVLEMHRQCITRIYPCAGRFRGQHVKVEVKGAEHLTVAPAHLVRLRIRELCEVIESLPRHDVEVALSFAPQLLHGVTSIHPFSGGNGRVARALVDLFLYRQGMIQPGYHIGYEIERYRETYLLGLKAADNGNFGALSSFCARVILSLEWDYTYSGLVDFNKRVDGAHWVEMPESVKELCDPDRRAFLTAPQFLAALDDALGWHHDQLLQIRAVFPHP